MHYSLVRFALALLATAALSSSTISAQTTNPAPNRSFTGWKASSSGGLSKEDAAKSTPAGSGPSVEPEVKTAYYQSQGGFSDLPAFPGASLSDGNLSDNSAGFDLPSLPNSASAMPSQNPTHLPALGASQSVPSQVQPPTYPPRSDLPRSDMPIMQSDPTANPLGRPNSPAPVPNRNRGVALDNSLRAEPAQYTAPNNQAVLPPNTNQFNGQSPSYGGVASNVRSAPAQPITYQNSPRQSQGNELRPIENQSSSVAAQGRLDPRNITTGPPFVTPPSRSRYATSPYNQAYFQMAAYQRAQSSGQANGPNTQLVSAQNQVSPPPQDPRQNLPQYATAQPGIYPTAYQCATPAPSFPATGAVPGAYVPPTFTPNLAPGVYSTNNSGYSPLFSLGQENYNVQLGRGLIGQPTVYVPGQPVRNFLRYLSP